MSQRIKTNIKFSQGLNNVSDKLYGFVTKCNGSWRGCREDSTQKKKIVFVDEEICKDVLPNILYHCSLIPMRNEGGFIAKHVTPVKFKATITTVCNKKKQVVRVTFGNKVFVYDPSSQDKHKNDIKTIADTLRVRNDLENAMMVAEDFVDNACLLQRLYQQSQSIPKLKSR